MAKITAVIDIGSNSARMVIYEKSSRFAFHPLHEATSRVRLPENAYAHDGFLQEEAMQRTYDALENFLTIAASFKARKILCVATSALRDAPNKQDFITRVRDGLKLNIKVIDGKQEALYGARACLNLLPKSDGLTIDIGGGSTEFTYIIDQTITDIVSLPLGTVRLKELYFDRNDIDGAIVYIDKQIEQLPNKSIKKLIGIGGTFRSISNAIMKKMHYPLNMLHGFEFSLKDIQKMTTKILQADTQGLKEANIKSLRYDTIQPGSLIIQRVLHKISTITTLTTSGVGVREGVFLSDLLRHQNYQFPNNYNPSVRFLIDKLLIEKEFSNQLASLSKTIFELIHLRYSIDSHYKYELVIAAKLSPLGSIINFYSYHQHSYYLIQNSLEYGFTHEQIVLIATLVRFTKRKAPSKSHLATYKDVLPNDEMVEMLSFIISLASALLSHRPQKLDYSLSFANDCLHVRSKDNLHLVKEALIKLALPSNLSVKLD